MSPIESTHEQLRTKLAVGGKFRWLQGKLISIPPPGPIPTLTYGHVDRNYKLQVAVDVTYQYLSQLANTKYLPLEIETEQGVVFVKEISFYKDLEHRLVIALDVEFRNSFLQDKGKIYLTSTPKLECQELRLKELKFHLETRNILVKAGAWILISKVTKKIEDRLVFNMSEIIERKKKQIKAEITNIPIGSAAIFQSEINRLELVNVGVGNTAIRINTLAVGSATISIE